jgi:hypothetical protein
MVWAEVAKFLSGSGHETVDDGRSGSICKLDVSDARRAPEAMDEMEDFEALRPPYIHVCVATDGSKNTGMAVADGEDRQCWQAVWEGRQEICSCIH